MGWRGDPLVEGDGGNSMESAYLKDYQERLRSVEQIIDMIHDGAFISAGQFAGNPQGLLSGIHRIQSRAKNVTLQSSFLMGDYPFLAEPGMEESLLLEAWFYGAKERAAHPTGLVSLMPGGLGLLAAKKLSYQRPTMFWGMSSPMDSHGNFNLGMSVAYEMDMLEAADIVVIEVNDQAPRVFGGNTVHLRDVDFVVEHSAPMPTTSPAPIGEAEDAIGRHVASLIEDGACIQLGIGNIPDAVGNHLSDKNDLGVHTELITDSMARLWEQGVITNQRKKLWPGKMIGTLVLGSQALYDFIDDNPQVELHRGSIVNNPYFIAMNDNQVSVNTALQVDLTGAVASESIGPRQFSATGGQFETAYGAQLSRGGKSIIALHATAKNGAISTIIPTMESGTVTTLSRNDVDYVVTEFGIAPLRGRPIRERVENLISIAHPKFRSQLEHKAKELRLW